MKKTTQQLVVMANGDVRVPEGDSLVGHGHRPADERIKIVVPAMKHSVLVEIEVELDAPMAPSLASRSLA